MLGLIIMGLWAAALPNATVIQPVANLYSKPSLDADVVSQALYSANVAIIEERDGWAHVRAFDDYTGWAPLTAVRKRESYAATGRVAKVVSLFVNIYREPDATRHAPVITVPFETRLEIVSDPAADARWLQARLPGGQTAWIQRGDVSFENKPLSTAETVEFAKRFLGLPYTWGGTSAFGYDCSGFTQMLNRQRGVFMPRDAQPQADWSRVAPVDRKDVRPGDLVFFGSSPKHITHTGMYIGGGKFINATSYQTPVVRIDDLDDPHFAQILVAIRRVK